MWYRCLILDRFSYLSWFSFSIALYLKISTSTVAFQDLCPYGHGTIPGIDDTREGRYPFPS